MVLFINDIVYIGIGIPIIVYNNHKPAASSGDR